MIRVKRKFNLVDNGMPVAILKKTENWKMTVNIMMVVNEMMVANTMMVPNGMVLMVVNVVE